MTQFVDIKPGQWVLAFDQPYGPHDRSLSEHIETFAFAGGGWDADLTREMFLVHEVVQVWPKTYLARRLVSCGAWTEDRYPRANVIATVSSEGTAKNLARDLIAIGVETENRIEAEMYRRIQKFADRERAKALKKIHSALPDIFRRPA